MVHVSEYIIVVNNGTNSGSVKPDIGFSYTENLNELNEADMKFSSLNTITRGLITMGATVLITRNAVNAFYGFIDSIDNVTAGGISVHVSGYECWLTKEPRVYTNSPWVATASATIATSVIGESTHLSKGTTAAGLSIDLRVEQSDTLWNTLGMICRKTGQDISVDYSNIADIEISVVNHKGASTSSIVMNNGFELNNPKYTQGYPSGNSVTVWGKGDGSNQIKSKSHHGQDATSIAAYGTIYRPVINRNVISTAEADSLADKEVILTKDPIKIYSFNVVDINTAIVAGDIITVNAADLGISSEDVRITQVHRGVNADKEFLELQMANAGYGKMLKLRDRYLSDITRQSLQESTQMQGGSNILTWGHGINAKLNYPLSQPFQIPAAFITDVAGKIRVETFTVDYDVDPYKKGGAASFTGSDPQVQNSSANTQPDVVNDSGNTGPDVVNSSGSTGPDVVNDSGSTQPAVTGTTSDSADSAWSSSNSGNSSSTGSGTLTDSSWTTITDTSAVNVSSDLVFYFATFKNTNLANSRVVRLRVYIGGTYYPNSSGTWTEINAGDFATIPILCPANLAADDIVAYAQTESGDMGYEVTWNYQVISKHTHNDGSLAAANHDHTDGTYAAASHSHSDGTYAAASHLHSDGTYSAANHLHSDGTYDINASDLSSLTIGDDVSDAAGVNSTQVSIYLDFWSGVAWVNKHSILNTGKTLDTDVDISNGGVYPDAAGLWRVRVDPSSASADYIQAIVKMKHNLDN